MHRTTPLRLTAAFTLTVLLASACGSSSPHEVGSGGASTSSTSTSSTGRMASSSATTSSSSSSRASSSSTSSSSGAAAGGASASSSSGATDAGACFYGDGGCFGLCCGDTCADTVSDPNNCGYCGQVCPSGSQCVLSDAGGGACDPPCTATDCPAGMGCDPVYGECLFMSCGANGMQIACASGPNTVGACCGGSTCTDTQSDTTNCGECGNDCSQGVSGPDCVGGQCTTMPLDCATAPPNSPCVQPNGSLGSCCGTCVDAFASTCGQVCPPGSTLFGSSCQAPCSPGSTCADGSMCAGGFCALQCNQNGVMCPSGAACVASPLGGGDICLATSCSAGTERESCARASGVAGECCGSSCTDVLTDGANCGACGNACGSGKFCDAGECVTTPTCAAGNSGVACPLSSGGDGVCCSGTCVAGFANDPSNCGGCGAVCPTGDTCVAGQCQGSGTTCPANTLSDGSVCLLIACPAGASGVLCAFDATSPGTCCDGVCVDTTSSPDACGQCGTVCPSGACYAGACVPVPFSPAPASCAAPGVYYVDPALGGECAIPACPPAPPVEFCAASGALGVCCSPNGFTAPTCVDTATDPKNCGGCGQVCAGSETCQGGVCSGATSECGAGRAGGFCDLGASPSWLCCGGACLDTSGDSNNCGACGSVCGSGTSCLDSQCVTTSCTGQPDATLCDAAGAVGACCSGGCVNTMNDAADCGSCGIKCAGSQTCEAGICGVDACTPTIQGQPCHFDAMGVIEKGLCCGQACVDSQDDTSNCGGCGVVCQSGQTCVGGNCM